MRASTGVLCALFAVLFIGSVSGSSFSDQFFPSDISSKNGELNDILGMSDDILETTTKRSTKSRRSTTRRQKPASTTKPTDLPVLMPTAQSAPAAAASSTAAATQNAQPVPQSIPANQAQRPVDNPVARSRQRSFMNGWSSLPVWSVVVVSVGAVALLAGLTLTLLGAVRMSEGKGSLDFVEKNYTEPEDGPRAGTAFVIVGLMCFVAGATMVGLALGLPLVNGVGLQ